MDGAPQVGRSSSSDDTDSSGTAVQVFCRVRPALQRDMHEEVVVSRLDPNTLRVENTGGGTRSNSFNSYQLDHIFSESATQQDVFHKVLPMLRESFQGYNSTVFAYGQTGTGKTHTMLGVDFWQMALEQETFDVSEFTRAENSLSWGLIPQTAKFVFQHLDALKREEKVVSSKISCSYLELYNEKVIDLLGPSIATRTMGKGLNIREDKSKGVYVPNASDVIVEKEDEVLALLWEGAQNRAISATDMNEHSSRSHTIFQFVIHLEMQPREGYPKVICRSKLNLVDLAGSETMKTNKIANLSGTHIQELTAINQSLSCLGNCIRALSQHGRSHVPYRDSKLTRLLQDSLGGNTKTSFIVTVSPGMDAYAETISTLQFADRAKRVVMHVIKNEQLVEQAALKRANIEISRLKELLRSQVKLEQREGLQPKTNGSSHDRSTVQQTDKSVTTLERRVAELEAALSEETQKREVAEEEYANLLKQTGRRMRRTGKAVIEPLICRLDRPSFDSNEPASAKERRNELNWMSRYSSWLKTLPITAATAKKYELNKGVPNRGGVLGAEASKLSTDQRLTLMEWSVLLQMEELEVAKQQFAEATRSFKDVTSSVTQAVEGYSLPNSSGATTEEGQIRKTTPLQNRIRMLLEEEDIIDSENTSQDSRPYRGADTQTCANNDKMTTRTRDEHADLEVRVEQELDAFLGSNSDDSRRQSPFSESVSTVISKRSQPELETHAFHTAANQEDISARDRAWNSMKNIRSDLDETHEVFRARHGKSRSPLKETLGAGNNGYAHINSPGAKSPTIGAPCSPKADQYHGNLPGTPGSNVYTSSDDGSSDHDISSLLEHNREELQQERENDASKDDAWVEYYDTSSNQFYYHNSVSNETTWEKPSTLAQ